MKYCLLILLLLMAGALPLRAQLVFDTDRVEVTLGWKDAKANGRFGFRNASKEKVEITAINPSCSCTTAELEKRVYAPGERGEIVAAMTIDRVLGQGLVAKQIVVKTGGKDGHAYVLTLAAQWPPVVKLEPQYTTWHDDAPRTPHKLLITVAGDQQIRFTSLKVFGDTFTAELHELEAGRRYEVVITPTAAAKMRDSVSLTINGDYPADDPMPVQAFAYIVP